MAVPEDVAAETDWLDQGAPLIKAATVIMPFAGIAFLWFIGVIRDWLGDAEDKFFSTVFFGSGILFLAMVFVSMSLAAGMIVSADNDSDSVFKSEITHFARALMFQISNVYALRMAGVFMISLGTIWIRTGAMPKPLAITTYLAAAALLLVVSLSLWVTLIFPAWVLLISLYILTRTFRGKEPLGSGG
jgi:hypothetical protein